MKHYLTLVGVLSFVGTLALCCARDGKPVAWPELMQCAPPPAEVVQAVRDVLAREPGAALDSAALAALESLAREYGPAVVMCAARVLVPAMSSAPGIAVAGPPDPVAARARAFLRAIGQ